ncbi:hypothetical protein D3C87_1957850 [compost metagenome]
MQQLVLAVRQFLEHHRFGHALLFEAHELEAHDALVGCQGWHRLADVVASRGVEIGLQHIADGIQVER